MGIYIIFCFIQWYPYDSVPGTFLCETVCIEDRYKWSGGNILRSGCVAFIESRIDSSTTPQQVYVKREKERTSN